MSAQCVTKEFGGIWCGSYGLVPGPGHSRKDRSLKVWDSDGKTYVYSFAGDDWRDCREYLGLSRANGGGAFSWAVRTPRGEHVGGDAGNRHLEACAIWQESRPALHTPAEAYLKARGIALPPPPAIRFHESLNALVAAVQGTDGAFLGVQRIYLDGDRYTAKRSLGPIKGGTVRLCLPASGTIQLTESLEDGLALWQMTGRPTWACLGTAMLASFETPPELFEVILAPDHDRAGLDAIAKAVDRHTGQPRLRQLLPPEGMDWCDVLEDHEERQAIQEEPPLTSRGTGWEEFCNGI